MGRSPCCSKEGLNRGAWTAHEDKILTEFIRVHGEGRWRDLPKRAGLKRCGKSCRLRWLNYLRPDIKRGNISSDEEELIIRLHNLLGNRWSLIAGRLPGRTDNEIKNFWNTNFSKKVKDRHLIITTSSLSLSAKSTENRKPPLTPKDKVTASPSTALPKLDSHVVRTKASKCSKVLFTNPLPHSSTQLRNKSKAEVEAEAARPLLVDAVSNSSISNQVEPSDNSRCLSFINEDEKEPSTDFLIDCYVGDNCLSDLMNSDFSNMCDFSYSNNNNDELLSPCSDQPLVFSDEILKDWAQSNFADETNVSNHLHSFTSFLESSEA